MTATTDLTGATLDVDRAIALQGDELERTVALLRTLGDAEWSAATDCPEWDVRRLYLHVLGACEGGASMRENAHQMRRALRRRRRAGGPLEAALSWVQVSEREDLSTSQIVDRLAAVAPRTVRGRARLPGLARRIRIGVDGSVVERWSLGYLTGTIYLRDLWMHRVDACRAVGAEPVLTGDHDGVIVADVVAEWARRHGRPFALELTGPAGGVFAATGGDAGAGVDADVPATVRIDAVEFCRVLAGRAELPAGLPAAIVPF